MNIVTLATAIGLLAAVLLLLMLVWSIAYPERRLWPPKISTATNRVTVWVLTITIFGSAMVLGIVDWNYYQWPTLLRWGIGLPLIVVSNWIVWQGALNLGMEATSGAIGELQTGGFYRYSRNPQYVADMGIFIGWAILSASQLVWPVVGAGILVLLVAPVAEEPWLRKTFGQPFKQYCRRVRRYLSLPLERPS